MIIIKKERKEIHRYKNKRRRAIKIPKETNFVDKKGKS